MSPRNPQLDGLRQQIDSLDDRIHDLLMERSGMIEQIIAAKGHGSTKLRPGREAEIARRLIARHRGHFPPASLIRIWREVINAFTCMQGPFSIAVSGTEADREIRELARDHFGGTPDRLVVEDSAAALKAVIASDATLAVLPWGEGADRWFAEMMDAADPGLRICFGLPFVRESADVGTLAVAVGKVESEPTDSDRSALLIADASDTGRDGIEATVRELGLAPLLCVALGGEVSAELWGGKTGPFWILEIPGQPDPEAMARINDAFFAKKMSVFPFGAYAEPIFVLPEEQKQ